MATLLLTVLIIGATGFAIFNMIRSKKKGKGCCGSCEGCSGCHQNPMP